MKPGDLVKVLERTMGIKINTCVSGILIKKSDDLIGFWDVLICGKIKSIDKNSLQEL